MSDELKIISPRSIDALVAGITPELMKTLRTVIELGKWQDGSRLSTEQYENCIQVLILYENKYVAESRRAGFSLSDAVKGCGNKLDLTSETVNMSDEAISWKR
jgi:uncharacterized protein YeaC (DUF1315 family)|tara:strand:+ start:177 stop:485 length:309 start_codon:yes stop_codon:yes gene_type:complete